MAAMLHKVYSGMYYNAPDTRLQKTLVRGATTAAPIAAAVHNHRQRLGLQLRSSHRFDFLHVRPSVRVEPISTV